MRFTNTLVTLAAAIAAAGLLAACGSSAASTGSSAPASSGGSAPATAPATSGWTPGGSYAGPVPPPNTTGLPDPSKGWQLPLYTSPDGYKVSDRLIFGVPLHYAIPQVLIDCNTAYPGQKSDLPPGQYVIPFEMRVENETGQQAPALAPLAWIGDVSGNATLSMTNGQHGADTYGTWQDGSCNMNNGIQLNAGGSTALYGFVGPATPAQLASAYVYVSWATGNNVPGTPPQLSMPLASLLPPAGASWLAAHGGHAPAPAASPSSMPVACPSAPSGLTGDEQANFNSVCGIWIGQVSDLTNQFNGSNGQRSPGQTAEAYCSYYDGLSPAPSDPATTPAGMDHACRLGIAAAGGPAANAS